MFILSTFYITDFTVGIITGNINMYSFPIDTRSDWFYFEADVTSNIKRK